MKFTNVLTRIGKPCNFVSQEYIYVGDMHLLFSSLLKSTKPMQSGWFMCVRASVTLAWIRGNGVMYICQTCYVDVL